MWECNDSIQTKCTFRMQPDKRVNASMESLNNIVLALLSLEAWIRMREFSTLLMNFINNSLHIVKFYKNTEIFLIAHKTEFYIKRILAT